MKAYKSNTFFYVYSLTATLLCALAFILLPAEKGIELPLLICGRVVLAAITVLSLAATVSHLLLPVTALETDDESITLYKRRTKTTYKLCEISKIKVWMSNTFTLKFNMSVGGKAVNVEYHVKNLKNTRTLFVETIKAHGIEIEEYVEEVAFGD